MSSSTETSHAASALACLLVGGDAYYNEQQRFQAVGYFCLSLTAINILFDIFYLTLIVKGRISPPCGMQKSQVYKLSSVWYGATGTLKVILASLLFTPILQPGCPDACSAMACEELAPSNLGPTLYLLVSFKWLLVSYKMMGLSKTCATENLELPTLKVSGEEHSETTASVVSDHSEGSPTGRLVDIGSLA